jgi:transposase IS116/IS110/IS902 family protein
MMRVRIARDELRRLRELTETINALEVELGELVAQVAPQLIAEPGCGPLTAAKLGGEIAGADRFSTDAKLARAAGIGANPSQLGTNRPPPPRPRRQPPNQRRDPPHRRHPSPLRSADPGLHRTQEGRRQDQPRRHPLPQTPPRPPHLAAPTRAHPDQKRRHIHHFLT